MNETTEQGVIAAELPKIQHRHHLNVRPAIDEDCLPFVGKVKYKTKSGKYLQKRHHWRVKKGGTHAEGLQYAVDFIDMIKTNQDVSEFLITSIFQDMNGFNGHGFGCKYEFVSFICEMLTFAAKHADYTKFAENRLELLIKLGYHNPDMDEGESTKAA